MDKELLNPIILSDDRDQYISKRLIKMQLADIRKSKKLTQKDISILSGLSIQCISDIENNNSGNPTLSSLIRYLDCLGLEIAFKNKCI